MTDILTAAVAKGFAGLLAKLSFGLVEKAASELKESVRLALVDFQPHLSATFDRCTLIKTILSKHEPINLLDCYVNLKFRSGPHVVDDYELIDNIRKKKRVVISGTGGGGKTIFLRYLWISFFENPGDRIPIFIELRRINDLTIEDIKIYIYHTIAGTGANFSIEDFNKFVNTGKFIFILDGFDEVSKSKKKLVERQILEFSRFGRDCIIVVSGRPDDRFDAWQNFTNYSVCPLDEAQVVSLVNKLPYDKGTKKRFIDRLKRDDLLKKHSSFLSNPLLVTMMLLTFKDYADIPEKVHLFYAQAFDALYQMHDASKEEFKRELYADLPSDLFKKYFSYFCLFSYHDEVYEFSKDELNRYINLAISAQGGTVVVDDFIRDAIESVCLLQVDGVSYTFTHRSFQEYFSAYCLAFVNQLHQSEILNQLVRRKNDSTLVMLHDMRPEVVRDSIIMPALDIIFESVDFSEMISFVKTYTKAISEEVYLTWLPVRAKGPMRCSFHGRSDDDLYHIVALALRIFPNVKMTSKRIDELHKKDSEIVSQFNAILPKPLGSKYSVARIKPINNGNSSEESIASGSETIQIDIDAFYQILSQSGYYTYCYEDFLHLKKVCKKMQSEKDVHRKTIEQIFNFRRTS